MVIAVKFVVKLVHLYGFLSVYTVSSCQQNCFPKQQSKRRHMSLDEGFFLLSVHESVIGNAMVVHRATVDTWRFR